MSDAADSTIITEADARQIEPGATVELAKGGHVTPLAQDTLRERRVTVVPAGSVDPALPADLAPASRHPPRRDRQRSHRRGAARRRWSQHLRGRGHRGRRPGHGRHRPGGLSRHRRGGRASGRARRGRRRASSSTAPGIGSAIAANKIRGVRAAMCTDETHRALRARAQRRQRHDARLDAAAGPDAAIRHRRRLARHADARSAIYSAAAEDPPARGVVLTSDAD